jgi:DNA polymerase-3 subunit delta'
MKDIIGNTATIKYLKDSIKGDNLSHAYLFCGPENVGKTKIGLGFARLILCEGEDPFTCTECPSCKLFVSGNHPDFHYIDKEMVSVDEIRELSNTLELKPFRGKSKVALISHAEKLTTQALNSFLKTLEEPTPHTVIILTTENKKNLLETIVSRSRMVNFGLVPDKQIYEFLNSELEVKRSMAEQIVNLAGGRIGHAITLSADQELTVNIASLASEFLRTYRSQDIHDKITFADKISKEKDSLDFKLQSLEMAIRGELMQVSSENIKNTKTGELVTLLDRLTKSAEMIRKNGNTRLIMEGLLLGSIS